MFMSKVSFEDGKESLLDEGLSNVETTHEFIYEGGNVLRSLSIRMNAVALS